MWSRWTLPGMQFSRLPTALIFTRSCNLSSKVNWKLMVILCLPAQTNRWLTPAIRWFQLLSEATIAGTTTTLTQVKWERLICLHSTIAWQVHLTNQIVVTGTSDSLTWPTWMAWLTQLCWLWWQLEARMSRENSLSIISRRSPLTSSGNWSTFQLS